MKTKLVLGAVAAAVALFSQAALAQSTAPVTRAEVKSEAKSGAPRTGDAPVTTGSTASGVKSTKTRTERKDETKAAAAAGELKPAGQIDPKAEEAARKSGTQKTRAERKAETAAAPKTPAGDAPMSGPGGTTKK